MSLRHCYSLPALGAKPEERKLSETVIAAPFFQANSFAGTHRAATSWQSDSLGS
jgi:hypothetical protein